MVDKEMAATSAAIEEAVRRIEVRGWAQFLRARRAGGLQARGPCSWGLVWHPRALCPHCPPPGPLTALSLVQDMMNQARHASSGVKLEVNER